MAVSEQDLVNAAVAVGLLSLDELDAVKREARKNRQSLTEAVSRHTRTPRAALWRAAAEARGVPFVSPGELTPCEDDLSKLPTGFIRRRRILPIRRADGALLAAVANPDDAGAIDQLGRALGAQALTALAYPEALSGAVDRALGDVDSAAIGREGARSLLDEIIDDAYLAGASDIHICPEDAYAQVRLRVDGRLQDWRRDLKTAERDAIINRIKVLSDLDIAESRAPQDGGFRHDMAERYGATVEIRVSCLPVKWGERAALRLLGVARTDLGLDDLGVPDAAKAELRREIRRPHGVILVTGPTGSGKSTTLYAALREIDRRSLNVMTVEDPIEQIIPGAAQVQVSTKFGFAGALRSILRQDPDVILIGEIRDGETADIALKAAQTGHLVFSTLHTNNAVGAITRLSDLGVGAYQTGSALCGVLAQRLIRRLCRRCAVERAPDADERRSLQIADDDPAVVKDPVGCVHCMGAGYTGRIGVFETLWIGEAARRAIAGRAPEDELIRAATSYEPLETNLRERVLEGVASMADAAALGLGEGPDA